MNDLQAAALVTVVCMFAVGAYLSVPLHRSVAKFFSCPYFALSVFQYYKFVYGRSSAVLCGPVSSALPPGRELWNFRSLELSPLYQYEKRITDALSTEECSSLPTNVALQSVLTYRHVRHTYDADMV